VIIKYPVSIRQSYRGKSRVGPFSGHDLETHEVKIKKKLKKLASLP